MYRISPIKKNRSVQADRMTEAEILDMIVRPLCGGES